MFNTRKYFVTLMLTLIAGSWSAASLACSPITNVPFTILDSGTYCLTGDLNLLASNDAAITVTTNNVTIDLRGHLIGSSGTNNSAIFAGGINGDLKVMNGSLQNFVQGVVVSGSNSGALADNIVIQNMSIEASLRGIYMTYVKNAHILNNHITSTNNGVTASSSYSVNILDNSIIADYGISMGGATGTIRNNSITSIKYDGTGATGASLVNSSTAFEGNVLHSFNDQGVYFNGGDAIVRNNTIYGSSVPYSLINSANFVDGGGNYPAVP